MCILFDLLLLMEVHLGIEGRPCGRGREVCLELTTKSGALRNDNSPSGPPPPPAAPIPLHYSVPARSPDSPPCPKAIGLRSLGPILSSQSLRPIWGALRMRS